MHSTHQQQDRSASICGPATDYAVVTSSSPFSALHLLRNYRLFGTGTGPAATTAAAAATAETGMDRSRRFFVGETGTLSSGRSRRLRSEKRPIPDEQKDDKYYERRKRNNQAAKKSRDARKIREDHIALRATMFEHENAILRSQILALREEAQSLRRMLIEQQMPKIHGRYIIDYPRTSITTPTIRPAPSGPNVTITSAAPDSSLNGTILFSHTASKVATTLFL